MDDHAAELADGKLVFAGPDRRVFLNGLLTSDVLALKAGESQEACVLTPKGRLVARLALCDRGEDMLALCRPESLGALKAALGKSIMLSETTMTDAGESLRCLFAAGPGAASALRDAVGRRPSATRVFDYPFLGAGGKAVLAEPKAFDELAAALKARGVAWMSPETLETLRVEAGEPVVGVDLDAEAYPLEAGLERALSFTKGCYLGQETTARMKNLGRPNRALAGLKLERRVRPGATALSGTEPVGRLTSVVDSPRLGVPLGLALLRAESAAPGTRLEVDDGGLKVPAVVIKLPLK